MNSKLSIEKCVLAMDTKCVRVKVGSVEYIEYPVQPYKDKV